MSNSFKIPAYELKIGMYVSSLDRPWIETPFLLQGFTIETEQDIDALCRLCEYVYIDVKPRRQSAASFKPVKSTPRKSTKDIFFGKKLNIYTDQSDWRSEYPQAQEALNGLSQCVEDIVYSADNTITLDMIKVKQAAEPMIDSITRNPDACIWLAKMKAEDDYTFHHSLSCSIWAVALGRQLGLPKADLRSLAVGGLLFDVGKLQIDKALLTSNRRLSTEEFEQIKQHVGLGVDALRDSGIINKDILDMVAYHHERHNGKGYPNGLAGNDIPVFARIASIVDCYDAITSHRHYAKALPPSLAIKKLYEWKDIDFQAELVEEFIQAVGIYPAGTLVELSSGEVAIVVAEYRSRRLRPQVLVMLDQNKNPLADAIFIDLLTKTQTADGRPLEIIGSLEPDAYGIDMTAIQL
ncbi:MAG TPA: HD-GYP domain-containing protein [Spongiibacteraceae bacterium]|nr:HD-GYP domain-containing protein [Spongiibacteraceae bacterium]